MERGVGHLAALEDLAVVPGEAVVVGNADGAVGAGTGGVGVGEEQDAGARGALGGIRVGADDGGVVTRVGQVPVVAEGAPRLAAVVGDGFEALARGALRARVEQEASVGELDDLVFVRAALGGGSGLPGNAVIVGVDGDGHEGGGARVGDGVLLDEAPGVGAVAQLDALAGGGEAGEPLAGVSRGDLVGDGAGVGPGFAVVVGFDDVGVQDVARGGVGAQLRLEEARVVGLHGEQEDRPGGAVDDEGRVRVADLGRTGCAGEGGHNGGPGLAAVLGDAVDDGVGLGCVLAGVGASVPRGDDPAVGGGGQRGDAVAVEAGEAGGREANLVSDGVVGWGFERVGRGWARARGDGNPVGGGDEATGDDVGAVAVARRRPGGGGSEGTGRDVLGGHGVRCARALLGGVRGEVVPAAVGGAGRQDARQVGFRREDGERAVCVVGVGEGHGHDIADVQGVPTIVGARGGDGDWGRAFVACRGRGDGCVAGVTGGGGQGGGREGRAQQRGSHGCREGSPVVAEGHRWSFRGGVSMRGG